MRESKASEFQVKENDFLRTEFRNGEKKNKRFSGERKNFQELNFATVERKASGFQAKENGF